MIRSISPAAPSMAATKPRSGPGGICTDAAGSPAASSPAAMQALMARAECRLSEPPRRITALPALRQIAGRVRADVGPALVDHADHADRGRDALDAQAVRPRPVRQRARQRVGKGRHLLQAAGDGVDARRVERQPVAERGRPGPGIVGREVARVGVEDNGRGAAHRGGGFAERRVAGGGRKAREHRRRGARRNGGIAQPGVARVVLDVHGVLPIRSCPRLRRAARGPGCPDRACSTVCAYSSTRSSRWMISSRPRQPRMAGISALWCPIIRAASALA